MSTAAPSLPPATLHPVSALTRMIAVLLAVLTVPLAILAISTAVLWLDGGSSSASVTKSLVVGTAPRIEIQVDGGLLKVQGGPAGRVVLTEQDTVHGFSRASAQAALRSLSSTIRPTAGGVGVHVPSGFPDLGHFQFAGATSQQRSVTVAIPPGALLNVSSGPGAVQLFNLRGPIDVSVDAGFVELQHVAVVGTSRLRVTNGAIAGSVTMAGGILDAAVVSGGIDLTVSAAHGARLQVSVSNGSISLPESYRITPQKFGSASTAMGIIGGGQATSGQLTLATVNGGVALTGL